MQALFSGLESSFQTFGGVPQVLLFNHMRAVVIGDDRLSKGALMMNAEFLRFAAHWGFRPRACVRIGRRLKGRSSDRSDTCARASSTVARS
jgi:transposase